MGAGGSGSAVAVVAAGGARWRGERLRFELVGQLRGRRPGPPRRPAAAVDGDRSRPRCPSGRRGRPIEIVDVDGESFTLAELAGRPVFVENFATWCPTCRAQLGRTQEAAEAMGDDAVFVVLSVETDLSADDVAEYAEDNGFSSMRFAVMSPELLAAFADAFGTSAVNPPSTPHVVIAADGTAGELETGSISAAEIEEALRAAA